jgi:hypothetical protein
MTEEGVLCASRRDWCSIEPRKKSVAHHLARNSGEITLLDAKISS